MTIKFMYNGIKINGKLYKASYNRYDNKTIVLYLSNYERLPLKPDEIEIENESDIMTDYFESDTLRIKPDTKYYEDALKGFKAAEIHNAKRAVKHFETMLNKRKGTSCEQFYAEELKNRQNILENLLTA